MKNENQYYDVHYGNNKCTKYTLQSDGNIYLQKNFVHSREKGMDVATTYIFTQSMADMQISANKVIEGFL